MSIKVMGYVWDGYPGAGSELLAMLAMADWCDDRGSSLYPSMNTVAEKIRVGEKQARRIVQSLVAAGFLFVVGNAAGGAPGTTKQFRLNVEKLKDLADKKAATPPLNVTPPASVTPPMHGSPTPPASGSPTPPAQGVEGSHPASERAPTHGSLTTIEPPYNQIPNTAQSRHVLEKEAAVNFDDVDPQVVQDFKILRKAKKSPLTQTAINGIRLEAGKAGMSLDAALRLCCERGWAGFKADWVSPSAGRNSSPVQAESFRERDARIGRERWEEMTGEVHPDNLPLQARARVINVPEFLEITA